MLSGWEKVKGIWSEQEKESPSLAQDFRKDDLAPISMLKFVILRTEFPGTYLAGLLSLCSSSQFVCEERGRRSREEDRSIALTMTQMSPEITHS